MEFLEKDCTDKKLCYQCKGRCCKQTGCFFMPQDFKKIEYKFLKKKIDRGYISIAAANQLNGVTLPYAFLYLKVRNINSEICDMSTNGKCMLLTTKGCKFSFKKRPSGGKALIPSRDGCKSLYTESDILTQWKPYQDVLKQLWNTYSNN